MSFNTSRDLLFQQQQEPDPKLDADGNPIVVEQTPPPITAEDVAAQIALATTPLQHELDLANERLKASEAMNLQVASTRQPSTALQPRPERTGDEYVEQFTADALGATQEVAREEVDKRMERLEPVLQRQHDTLSLSLINAERLQMEAEYGAKAWELHIEPLLNARMTAMRETNQMAMADPDVIRNEVLSIMGHKRNELAEVKVQMGVTQKETEAARYEQIRAELNVTGMEGGTNAPTRALDAPLSETDLDYVQSKKNAGQTVDIHKLRKSVGTGATSWGAWKTAQEAK